MINLNSIKDLAIKVCLKYFQDFKDIACNTPKIYYSGRLNKLSGCYGDWYPTQDNIERDKVNIIKKKKKHNQNGVLRFTFIPTSFRVRPKIK